MKLLKLEADNVFSLDHVDLNLDGRGLCLVTGYSLDENGANGAGKSSLCNRALVWGLFGVSTDGIKADDVINIHTGRQTAWVRIDFESKGSKFRIFRQRGPASLDLFEWHNTKGWEARTSRLEPETQRTIDNLLGRNFTTWSQADFFGQGRQTAFPHLTPKAQREVIESIIPIEQLESWTENTKQAKRDILSAQEIISTELTSTTRVLESNMRNRDNLKFSHEQWESGHTLEISKLQAEIESVEEDVRKVEEQKTSLESELTSIGPEEPTQGHLQTISTLNQNRAQQEAAWTEALRSHNSWEKRVAHLESRIISPDQRICPTCNQPLPAGRFEKFQVDQESTQAELTHAKENLSTVKTAMDSVQKNTQTIADKLSELHTQLVVVGQQNAKRRQFQATLKNLKELSLPTNKVLQDQLKEKQIEESPFLAPLNNMEKDLIQLGSELSKLNEKLEELNKDKLPVEIWEQAFQKDLRNALFTKVCMFLNSRVDGHLQELNNPQLHVEFATLKELKSKQCREEFNVRCWSDTGGKNFTSLSGGEQQIVSFAIGLTLAELSESQVESSSNVMILDEPFLYLDSKNCESIVTYLTDVLAQKKETIFLVSNEDSLKALIPNRIHVVKEKGISRVESV